MITTSRIMMLQKTTLNKLLHNSDLILKTLAQTDKFKSLS